MKAIVSNQSRGESSLGGILARRELCSLLSALCPVAPESRV